MAYTTTGSYVIEGSLLFRRAFFFRSSRKVVGYQRTRENVSDWEKARADLLRGSSSDVRAAMSVHARRDFLRLELPRPFYRVPIRGRYNTVVHLLTKLGPCPISVRVS